MRLNKDGEKLREIWEDNFYRENDRLGGNSADGDFVDGWIIIDNDEYVKTLTDECGLLIYGYDDPLQVVDEWIRDFGKDDVVINGYTLEDVRNELLKYFD